MSNRFCNGLKSFGERSVGPAYAHEHDLVEHRQYQHDAHARGRTLSAKGRCVRVDARRAQFR